MIIDQLLNRLNVGLGVSANIGPEIGIGPNVEVNYEREGRVFSMDEFKETLDLGFHNNTKVVTHEKIFINHCFSF